MNKTLERILNGDWDNHILPFFWQHGEDEATLRKYMAVIQESGCGAVCVESRPHPDFCGPKWWADMDVILDEARTRGMKVWILDDDHFPTGHANGAVENAPQALCRQSVCANPVEFEGEAQTVQLALDGLIPPPFTPNLVESFVLPGLGTPRAYDDDTVLSVTAFCHDTQQTLDLSACVQGGVLVWEKPAGKWTVWVCGLSRNCGPHRNYINMLDGESCKLLLDAVYEPHYARYKADFGTTIAGFFSDESELGNGHLYDHFPLGHDQDLPFSAKMPAELEKRLGADWPALLYLLWENGADAGETARVRYAYMDAVTCLVRSEFSYQLGDWCRARGVEYIGHVVEDAGAHARTAAALGHYFRGLEGQDMSGIDDIGGQVYPQGDDDNSPDMMGRNRDADFYHFMLGRLASSAAAIEPWKKGRSMCEIFGNYGWAEGVHLEKYLVDHFMVRGVNHYVPHAFTPAPFPDQDCPPHFYAHGHNPQYRHFGELMRYMNRVCTLTSSGARGVQAAVLYHAEAEWAGKCMPGEKVGRVLEQNQIAFDYLPADVFAEPEKYGTEISDGVLRVNTQRYRVFILPYAQFITAATSRAIARLQRAGVPVYYIDAAPDGICNGGGSPAQAEVTGLDSLAETLVQKGVREIGAQPASRWLRVLHVQGGEDVYYIVNEGAEAYTGTITLPTAGTCCAYDAWANRLESLDAAPAGQGTAVTVTIQPLKSLVVAFGDTAGISVHPPVEATGREIPLDGFTRRLCEGAEYPAFGEAQAVTLPDRLAEEQPEFSGFVQYTTSFTAENAAGLTLAISDAAEGVEVFVNGRSAGIQISPPYLYDLSALARPGENQLVIEVATTLERQCYPLLEPMRQMRTPAPTALSGLTGSVTLYQK